MRINKSDIDKLMEVYNKGERYPFKNARKSYCLAGFIAFSLTAVLGAASLVVMVFVVALLSAILQKPLTDTEVGQLERECLLQEGKYSLVLTADKKQVLYVNCDLSKKAVDNESLLWDDETPTTATGLPSLSGLPGGQF